MREIEFEKIDIEKALRDIFGNRINAFEIGKGRVIILLNDDSVTQEEINNLSNTLKNYKLKENKIITKITDSKILGLEEDI